MRSTSATTGLAAVAGLVEHGFGDRRIERLVEQIHRFEALLAQLAEQQIEQRLDLGRVLHERSLAGVEHGQQRLGDPAGGPVDLVGLLASSIRLR